MNSKSKLSRFIRGCIKPVDHYSLALPMTKEEAINRLKQNTLEKLYPNPEKTDKDFIGRLDRNRFLIVSSSRPFAGLCVLDGTIEEEYPASLRFKTKVQTAFHVLFWLFTVAMTIVIVFLGETGENQSKLSAILGVIVLASFFRMFIYGIYILSRNTSLREIRRVFEIRA